LCWMTLAKAIARPARGKKQRVYWLSQKKR
jgi:hypothetical protein